MISIVVFTLNEEVNLPRCLESVRECDDVIVVDSFSSDRTCEIARSAGARVFQHGFTGFGDQRMWALETIEFRHPWILILDADEQVTPPLWKEMVRRVTSCSTETAAFRLKRRFYWEGCQLRRANLYPSWVVRLVRKGRVRFINRGHAETQEVNGVVEALEEDLIDENRKGLQVWRERQRLYAEQEARYEASLNCGLNPSDLSSSDPLVRRHALRTVARRLPARGLFYFVYAYFLQAGWVDGWTGLRFCWEKACFQQQVQRTARRLRAMARERQSQC